MQKFISEKTAEKPMITKMAPEKSVLDTQTTEMAPEMDATETDNEKLASAIESATNEMCNVSIIESNASDMELYDENILNYGNNMDGDDNLKKMN